jgi:hypothetical protein
VTYIYLKGEFKINNKKTSLTPAFFSLFSPLHTSAFFLFLFLSFFFFSIPFLSQVPSMSTPYMHAWHDMHAHMYRSKYAYMYANLVLLCQKEKRKKNKRKKKTKWIGLRVGPMSCVVLHKMRLAVK